jgi:hypothetical protein
MTLKSYLWGMRVSTVFALAGWILVVLYIDPDKSGAVGQLLFYGSTFLLLSGIFVLLLGRINRKKDPDRETFAINIGESFRQGVLLSLLFLIMLFFQEKGILTWWDGLLAVAGIFLVELYFLSHKH